MRSQRSQDMPQGLREQVTLVARSSVARVAPRLPATPVPARGDRPRGRRRRAGTCIEKQCRHGLGRVDFTCSAASAMGRDVEEQRSHRRRPTLAAAAQRRVSELPHDGAAGRAAAPRLGVYLGEEIDPGIPAPSLGNQPISVLLHCFGACQTRRTGTSSKEEKSAS